jgi:glycerol-3-phosphate dehydrogenase
MVCLWPWDDNEKAKLDDVLHESQMAGDSKVKLLSPTEVADLEPSISRECKGAVHIPGEIVVDPWLFALALATHCRALGKYSGRNKEVIQTGRVVVLQSTWSCFDKNSGEHGLWKLETIADGDENYYFEASCLINAAGIDSDLLQSIGSSHIDTLPSPKFSALPRRGQYAVFAPRKTSTNDHGKTRYLPKTIPLRPIQPIPSQFSKGIFVYSTLYDQLVIGPTAKDQSSRTDDVPEACVRKELTAHASRIMHSNHFDDEYKLVGEYVGIRPGTNKRDYQIHLYQRSNFITVGGIRSTGLTASLGIGRHVVQNLLPTILPTNDILEEMPSSEELKRVAKLPDVKDLVKQYHERGNGTIIVDGYVYKVTHPLTKLGWEARTGLAAESSFPSSDT